MKASDWADPRKQAAAVGIAVFAAGLLVSNAFVFSPLARRNQALRARLEAVKEKRTTLEALSAGRARIRKLESSFAGPGGGAWLIRAVKEAADSAGVRISSLTPENPERSGPLVRMPVSFEGRGDYHAWGRFAAKLESADKLVRFDRVRIEGPEQGPEQPTVFRGTVSVFSMSDDGIANG